jgi:predicted nucleic acid-binding protein
LIVADSSFLVEGLLKNKALLEEDAILTLDLAIYEIVNSIWKHHHILKDLSDGRPYVSLLYGLVESQKIRLIHPGRELMERSYSVAASNNVSVYDTVFIALALESGFELMTLDKQQATIMRKLSESRFVQKS